MSLPADIGAADDWRTIDSVIAANEAASIVEANKQGGVLVDGDMIVTPEQYSRFFDVKGDTKQTAFAGAGLIDESRVL